MSIVTGMLKDLNYAKELKVSSGAISNKYKKVYEALAKLANRAYEKGMIPVETLEDTREMLPTNNKIFTNEHVMGYEGITSEIDNSLNEAKLTNLINEDYTPELHSKVA